MWGPGNGSRMGVGDEGTGRACAQLDAMAIRNIGAKACFSDREDSVPWVLIGR